MFRGYFGGILTNVVLLPRLIVNNYQKGLLYATKSLLSPLV